jgi:hypothetical protein
MNVEDITKEKFASYVACQNIGSHNMLDPYVCVITGLDQGEWLCIIENYGELCEIYPDIFQKRR